jgi:multiple sugar transport system substrate-binding protein
MKKKYQLAFGIAAATATAALVPILAQGNVTRVSMWYHAGTGSEREALNTSVANFNRANRDVQIDLQVLPEGSYNDQVNAAALADGLPCVLDFDGPNLYNYAWSGKLVPMDKYITPALKNDLLPSTLKSGTYRGKVYGLGQFDGGLAIWGNRELLQKAGVRIPTTINQRWTRAEFEDALKKLKASGLQFPLDMKLNYGVGEWYTFGFSPIMQSFGGDLINRRDYKSAQGVLNGTPAVQGMTFLQSLVKNGYVNPRPAGDADFIEGRAALSYVGHWTYADYSKALGNKLVLIPMPRFGNRVVTGNGSWSWGISSDCKVPDQAARVVQFLMTTDEVLRMSNANGAVPSLKTAQAKSRLYASGGPLRVYADQLNAGYGLERPVTPAYPAITTAFAEAVNNIFSGADVKAELDKAVRKIDQNIQDNRGYPER